MSNTDFSVSAPTFVQFKWNGWPEEDKIQIEAAVRAINGVTQFNRAGGNSSFHLHFDPAIIDQNDLISQVNGLAEPILIRLRGSPSGMGRLSDDLILDDGSVTAPRPDTPEGTGPNQPIAETSNVEAVVDSPNQAALDAVSATKSSDRDVSASKSFRASAWTGNRSLPEQIETIRIYAPLALAGLDALVAAIEEKRFNDTDTLDALRTLKELRAAIDDLIRAAEGGLPLAALWDLIGLKSNDLIAAAKAGAKVMVAAPIVGVGAAYAISLLTGDPVTGQMAATMAGGSLMAGALAKNDKKP